MPPCCPFTRPDRLDGDRPSHSSSKTSRPAPSKSWHSGAHAQNIKMASSASSPSANRPFLRQDAPTNNDQRFVKAALAQRPASPLRPSKPYNPQDHRPRQRLRTNRPYEPQAVHKALFIMSFGSKIISHKAMCDRTDWQVQGQPTIPSRVVKSAITIINSPPHSTIGQNHWTLSLPKKKGIKC